jgi:hypothetical protein
MTSLTKKLNRALDSGSRGEDEMCSSDLVKGATTGFVKEMVDPSHQDPTKIFKSKEAFKEGAKGFFKQQQLGGAAGFGPGGVLFEKHRRGDFEESIEAPEVAQVRDTTDEQRATKERQQRLSEQRRRSASSTAATRLTSPLGVNQRAAVGRKSLLGQ